MTQLITREDLNAALLCELAAARLRLDHEATDRLLRQLRNSHALPAARQAAETLARAACDAERKARKP